MPNNIGSLSCFDLVTEPGTCVDPTRPSPVTARHVIGQMLADCVFGCLAQALPGKVQAESAGSIWILALNSAHGRVPAEETAKAKYFGVINIGLGGIGGRPGKDGLSTMAFPSGVGTIPVEVTETQCPLYFKRKEYLARLGRRRRMARRPLADHRDRQPRGGTLHHLGRHLRPHPQSGARARRRQAGRERAWRAMAPASRLPDKGIHVIPAGDSLVVELPGGGGFGDPQKRDSEAVAQDLKAGLVTAAGVRRDYGHEPA